MYERNEKLFRWDGACWAYIISLLSFSLLFCCYIRSWCRAAATRISHGHGTRRPLRLNNNSLVETKDFFTTGCPGQWGNDPDGRRRRRVCFAVSLAHRRRWTVCVTVHTKCAIFKLREAKSRITHWQTSAYCSRLEELRVTKSKSTIVFNLIRRPRICRYNCCAEISPHPRGDSVISKALLIYILLVLYVLSCIYLS